MSAYLAASVINRSVSTKKSSFFRARMMFSVSGSILRFMPRATTARMG